jgi:signal peptidase I
VKIGLAVAPLALAVLAFACQAVRARRNYVIATVHGGSMRPTLLDGETVKVRRRAGEQCRLGDIVVFSLGEGGRAPGDPSWRVKRVAAVAGDLAPSWMSDAQSLDQSVVPPGHLAVRGDHVASESSKELGYVPHAAVVGVVPDR